MIKGPALVPDENGYPRYQPNAEWIDETPEYRAHYRIDTNGFRINHQAAKQSTPMTGSGPRILFLGDSFTFGEGNDYEDTYVARLEDPLRNTVAGIEVINGGVQSYDQLLEYRLLEEILASTELDYVVVCFLPNDVLTNRPLNEEFNLTQRKNLVRSRSFKLKWQTLKWLKAFLLRSDPFYVQAYERSGRASFYSKQDPESVHEKLRVTKELFQALHQLCQEKQVELIVASIPQRYQVLKRPDDDFDPSTLDRLLGEVARRNGYHWIETLTALRTAQMPPGESTHYRVDGHLTPLGNKIVADALAAPISEIIRENETIEGTSEKD